LTGINITLNKELKEKIDEEIILMQEISDNGINVIYSRIHY